jgi:adenylate cyclase
VYGILVADVTGVSRLTGADEARVAAAQTRIRHVFTTVVPRHGGTLNALHRERFVALFESATDAVRAAMAIQADLASAAPAGILAPIRIGVHVGEVVRSGAEILGDSVQMAAGLQSVARPGHIAVSGDVYRAVRNRINVPFRDLGSKKLKPAGEVHVYEVDVQDAATGHGGDARSLRRVAVAAMGIAAVAGLAALGHRVAQRPGLLGVPRMAPNPAAPVVPPVLTVGVTGVSARGEAPTWMQDNTRDGLNTLLSKVTGLRVFSREKIDFLRQRRGLSEIEVAETLGIQKMISGSLALEGDTVVLEARVVDISTGVLEASEIASGRPDDLIEVENQLASALLAKLGVQLSAAERDALFAHRTKETLDAYRRLGDTFGEAPVGPPAPSAEPGKTSWMVGPRPAWAQSAEPEILALLERYRAALERKDLAGVAATHVELNEEQRAGFERYFASADDLSVQLSDVDLLLDGDEALVTFTRRDTFNDHRSGKPIELEVRLSSVVVQKDGQWLLRGVKRS